MKNLTRWLVSRVGSVQMKSIVPDAADVKKYGLDSDSFR